MKMPGGVHMKLVLSRAVCFSRPVHFCIILTSAQPHLKGTFSAFNRPAVIIFTSNSICILFLNRTNSVLLFVHNYSHFTSVVSIYACSLPFFHPSLVFLPKFLLTAHVFILGSFSFFLKYIF